jgi:hypothetical protein
MWRNIKKRTGKEKEQIREKARQCRVRGYVNKARKKKEVERKKKEKIEKRKGSGLKMGGGGEGVILLL